jgi:hypothetical protein
VANLQLINTTLTKFQGVTLDRVARSVRFRTMHLLARFEPVRAVADLGNRAPQSVASEQVQGSVDGTVATLRDDGIAFGVRLRPDIVEGIRAWVDQNPCYGNLNHAWGFSYPERKKAEESANAKFTVAHFFNTSDSDVIRNLAADPFFEEIAKRYVGPSAQFISTHMWWSFASDLTAADRHKYAQQFHFDLDDYRFVKFFFYLTDVDDDSGPHVYVKKSHRKKKLRDMFPMRRFSDEEAAEKWGASNITKVMGSKGDGFVVDTFGVHKGQPPRTRDRLVIEFLWGLRDWGFGTDVVPKGDLSIL